MNALKSFNVQPAEPRTQGMNGSFVEKIGKTVSHYRRDKLHMSQRDFAERVAISRRSLQKIEQGQCHHYSIAVLEKVLSSMGMGFREFVEAESSLREGFVAEGTLKGNFQIEYPGDGLRIISLTARHQAFFFGMFCVAVKRTIDESKLPHADFLLFQGFRGKLVFEMGARQYLLSEEKNLVFRSPVLPREIYNPDQVREASSLFLTIPAFL